MSIINACEINCKKELQLNGNETIVTQLASDLCNIGFNFFTSVPCGVLKSLLKLVEKQVSKKCFYYVPREDIGLGMACGAYLGGAKPIVLMQNSGFGQSINALASLVLPYRIPLTMIISIRGARNNLDSEENLTMGKITISILELLEIPFKIISRNNYKDVIMWSYESNIKNNYPVAILIEPKLFNMDMSK